MGDRNPRGGWRRQGRADAGHDLTRHAGSGQGQRLLATAAEHERVTTFEPHDAFALTAEQHQSGVDLGLRWPTDARRLAHVDELGSRRSQVQHARINQPVIDHHVGSLQALHGAQREQVGIARPRADQRHKSARRRRWFEERAFEFSDQQVGGVFEGTRLGQPLHVAVEGGLPAVGLDHRAGAAQSLARRGRHVEQVAPVRWQCTVQPLAGTPRQGRTATAGRDGDGHVAAPNQGRRDEVAVGHVVDGQHRDAKLSGVGGHTRIQSPVVGRTERQGCTGQITCLVLALQPLHLAGLSRAADERRSLRRNDDQRYGSTGQQRADFGRSDVAAADHDDAFAEQVEERCEVRNAAIGGSGTRHGPRQSR